MYKHFMVYPPFINIISQNIRNFNINLIEYLILSIDKSNILYYNKNIEFAIISRCEGGGNINGFEFYRKRAKLTQVQAAIAIGVTQGTISQWEAGQTFPARDKVVLVAKVYGCTTDELYKTGFDESA